MIASPGQTIVLHLSAEDVDEHPVYFKVWPYAEAGDGTASIEIKTDVASIKIPKTAKSGEQYHIIVEGTDTGFPALTRYQRVIIEVQ